MRCSSSNEERLLSKEVRNREEQLGVTLAGERVGDVWYIVGRNVYGATGCAHLDEVNI